MFTPTVSRLFSLLPLLTAALAQSDSDYCGFTKKHTMCQYQVQCRPR